MASRLASSGRSGVAFIVLLLLLLAAAPATADDDVAQVGLSERQQAAAVNHWTPDRMRSASSGDLLMRGRELADATTNVARGTATTVDGVVAPAAQLLGLPTGGLLGGGTNGGLYTGAGHVLLTTGKVFFTLGGTDYVCSGSSTAAANRSLVQTAGHCVNEGPGAFARNFIFVPAYRDGRAPYGRFAARRLLTTNQWRQRGDLSYDVGYAVVGTVRGKTLAGTVGAQGVGFNLARGRFMYAFGYPAAAPYDGSRLASCRGAVKADSGGTADQGLACNMTGGSSGGPWFAGFNQATGIGTLNSLNSFKYSTLGLLDGREMYGPYFGSVIRALYQSASR